MRFGKCVSAVYTNGKAVTTINVELSYSTIKTKSNGLVTVKW
jgi:hypothetical protein